RRMRVASQLLTAHSLIDERILVTGHQRAFPIHCSLLTAHCPLPHCPLPTAHYSLLTARAPNPTVRCFAPYQSPDQCPKRRRKFVLGRSSVLLSWQSRT